MFPSTLTANSTDKQHLKSTVEFQRWACFVTKILLIQILGFVKFPLIQFPGSAKFLLIQFPGSVKFPLIQFPGSAKFTLIQFLGSERFPLIQFLGSAKLPLIQFLGDRASYARAWSANDISLWKALHLGRAQDSLQVSSKFFSFFTWNIHDTQSLHIIPSRYGNYCN